MKRNKICYLLAIIAILTASNVYAYDLKGWSYCSVDKGTNGVTYSTGNNYEYHEQSITPYPLNSGDNLTMYCTYPKKSSGYVDPKTHDPNMICDIATTANFPTSYKLLKYVQDHGYNTKEVLDIAFRMAGIYDRVQNGTLVINQSSNYQLKSFYNTYLTRVLGQSNTGFDSFYLQGGVVDSAVQLLKDSKDLDISGLNPTGNTQQSETKIFTMELISQDNNSKTYKVTSNRPINGEPIVTANNVSYEWVERWNTNTGKIKITALSSTNCNGSVTFSASVDVGNTSAIYDCHSSVDSWQNYIAIGPSKAGDTFDVNTCPEPECMRNGCGVVEKPTEFKQKDIFNCCEEGAVTKLRQAALNELFCKDGTLKIDYYQPKCNAEEYVVNQDKFCTTYCGATAMYQLPGPTRAKADAYFYFDKKQTGYTGPVLNQYKRCRNVIYFDKWLEAYKEDNNQMIRALNDYNNYRTQLTQINAASGQAHTETITVSCPPQSGGTTRVITNHTVNMTKYVVSSANYNRFKYNVDTNNYRSITITADTDGQSAGGTYYAQSSIDSYNNTRNGLVSSNPGCDVSNNSFGSIENIKSEVESNMNSALANYNAFVSATTELRDGISRCSGQADANGVVNNASFKDKVQFDKEPEMEFSYNQVYLNDEGKLTSQELKIDFEKVDGKCIYKVTDALDKPDPNSPDWNNNWDITGIYKDQYSDNYGTGVLSVDTLKAVNSTDSTIGSVGVIKGDQFYASKKFTTDAVGHMTCKWQDSPKNVTYTLIPRGIVQTVTEIEGNIKDLGENYTQHTGTYHIVKTHARGKFETYFTLKNLADGIFDDIIHEGGKTCAELYADVHGGQDKTKADEVNATCYIDIETNGFTLYDCTQNEVLAKNDALDNKCCQGNNCTGGQVLDYKEVDPINIFPNLDQYEEVKGYAWNWITDEDGKKVLQKLTEDAANDKTYSKENMTYSFTLTPKDLKAIRAYNKAKIKDGGYTDFDMNCRHIEHVRSNGEKYITVEQCESKFIDAISGGSLKYGNGSELSLKTNNLPLSQGRNWN